MKTLISIDGGMSTGIAIGTYSDTEPYKLTHYFQITGGVEGFLERFVFSVDDFYCLTIRNTVPLAPKEPIYGYYQCKEYDFADPDEGDTTVIVEKFTARSVSQGGFSYRTRDLEPLRIEGAILAMGIKPTWVSPPQQYFSGGEGKAKKKQAQHKWLKDHGLYVAPKDVGSADADDVRSAIAHSISYLRRTKHMPSINYYFPETTDE